MAADWVGPRRGRLLIKPLMHVKRDGSLQHCPVCRARLQMLASAYGETQCPRCSGQLWHLALTSGQTFFVRRPSESIYEMMAELTGSRSPFTGKHLEAILRDADTVDVLEVLRDLEDASRSG